MHQMELTSNGCPDVQLLDVHTKPSAPSVHEGCPEHLEQLRIIPPQPDTVGEEDREGHGDNEEERGAEPFRNEVGQAERGHEGREWSWW